MTDNIIHISSRAEYRSQPEPTLSSDNIRGVAPIPAEHLRAILDPKPDLYDLRVQQLAEEAMRRAARAEAFTNTFRRWSWRIGIGLYAFAVVVAMYFAFQIGRGVL
jgi:hypothetical protein